MTREFINDLGYAIKELERHQVDFVCCNFVFKKVTHLTMNSYVKGYKTLSGWV